MNHYMEKYQSWVNSEVLDEVSKTKLLAIKDDAAEINDRFHTDLVFGTGGIRGIIGAGTNRINAYTIRRATQGLANFINHPDKMNAPRSVAIAYDSRHYSDLFAEEAALVMAANNIKAYVFETLRPTPELSFAVRYLKCDAGIVITASHNPPEYNGYKVYGPDGGQITLAAANAIISEISKLDVFSDVSTCTLDEAMSKGFVSYIGEDIDHAYLKKVTGLSVKPGISKEIFDFKIVYTPLHGAGLMPISRALDMLGYGNVHIVESQQYPDGNFSTVKSPNPEEREALTEAIRLANHLKADIVLGTDPDADRVGVAIRTIEGNYTLLTGNQIGALLTHYLVSNKREISHKDAVIKTIVTSELGAKIAEHYGATVFNTLTGFKFIGELMKQFEEEKTHVFLFGYEESHGYLAGTFVRDKDAVISSVLIAEMAAYYKLQDMTLLDVLTTLYKKHGFYTDALESYSFKGSEGQGKITRIMDQLRNTNTLLDTFPRIRIIEDFKNQRRDILASSQTENTELPPANVIKVHLSDESWFAARPSGTEPKLKIYYSTVGSSMDTSHSKMDTLKRQVNRLIKDSLKER